MRTIACLSVRQPWASLLAHGIKSIENRNFVCRNRELFAIHAGKTWGAEEQAVYEQLLQIAIEMGDERRQDVIYRSKNMLGGFVGVANLRECIGEKDWYAHGGRPFDGRQNWFTEPVGWFFTGARPFSMLVPYRGQQGIFRVPAAHLPLAEVAALSAGELAGRQLFKYFRRENSPRITK